VNPGGGVSGDGEYASLAMYPFDALRPAWQRLWSAVHEQLSWTPAEVHTAGDVHAHWTDPHCTVAHACGYPLAAHLPERSVVGAFALRLADADGFRYRSVLVAGGSGRRLAANSDDSLSGWISAMATIDVGDVTFTGSHAASLEAIAAGDADLAMIDALTLAHLRRLRPEVTAGLVEVARGPWIPSPPIVVPRATPPARLEELRAAFADALAADPAIGATLLLDGFVPLDRADYAPVLDLVP
jgi:ABC-type phosphate/phosphonate transport system substrate-binding protein